MVENSSPDWRVLAQANRIDPAEVELVFERFDAQRQFAAKGRGEPMALGQWFRFYRMEKASEGQQAAPAPSACSVDSDAVNNACIERPVEFLAVLEAYLEASA